MKKRGGKNIQRKKRGDEEIDKGRRGRKKYKEKRGGGEIDRGRKGRSDRGRREEGKNEIVQSRKEQRYIQSTVQGGKRGVEKRNIY